MLRRKGPRALGSLRPRLAFEPLEGRQLLTTLVVDPGNPDYDAPGDEMYSHLQEAMDASLPGDTIQISASGTLGLGGPPTSRVATSVADNCLVDISFPFWLSGTLEATGTADYRILAHGPCGSPPYTFQEEWIVLTDFTGSVDGVEGSFKAVWTAEVRDGVVTGTFTFGAGAGGLVDIGGQVDMRNDTTNSDPGTYGGTILINVEPVAGDATLDKRFDQRDIVQVLDAGKYNRDEPADFSQGDFNGDGRFNQFDLIAALQTGAYQPSL